MIKIFSRHFFALLSLSLIFFTLSSSLGQQQDTPLHIACRNNNVPSAKKALQEQPSRLNQLGQGSQTPLMASVLAGATDAVAFLLESGADVTIGEQDGYTPMHGAGFQGRADVAKLLIDHGIDPSNMHNDGFTPIHRAGWGKEDRHTDTVRIFLEAGVSVFEQSRDGQVAREMSSNTATIQLLKKWEKRVNDGSDL